MHLLAGLGNPGRRYLRSRHNVGFAILDAVADRHRLGAPRRRHEGELREGLIAGRRVLAVKPQTYMNESGRCIGAVRRWFNIDNERIIVFYDELDLPTGKLRVRHGGSSAGHRGVRSLIDHCGADFIRIRIGIGRPGAQGRVIDHVLGDFSRSEEAWKNAYLSRIADLIPLLLDGEWETFQNRMHRHTIS